jgi:hypothetical protein
MQQDLTSKTQPLEKLFQLSTSIKLKPRSTRSSDKKEQLIQESAIVTFVRAMKLDL